MSRYRHRFDRVEDYLHHRPPYLLVDEIVSITADKIVTRCTVSEDQFFVSGHFPGAPIMPGAMMQELTTQSAGILIAAEYNPMPEYRTDDPFFNEYALGVLVRVKQARYRHFARPGDTLTVQVQLDEQLGQVFDFSASITVAGNRIMHNRFQLTNIPSAVLQGTA
jgi:3-hydroxyacyl-[acyl-carrier-protein] dehydratase